MERLPSYAQVTPTDLNKVIDHVKRVTDIKVSPPLEVMHAGGGTQLRVIDRGFPAAVTGRTDLGASDSSNRWLYEVAEVIQVADGKWELKDNGRVLEGGIKVWEWNDAEVAVGAIVRVDQWDTYDWRFNHADGAAGDIPDYDGFDAAPCAGCGWLAEPFQYTQVLALSVTTALGRCRCVDRQGGDGAFLLVYDFDVMGWVGIKNLTTCCACCTVVFVPNFAEMTASLTLTCNESCETGGTFTLSMTHECCSTGSITFVGYGPHACSGPKQGCVDIFRVTVECTTPPDGKVCDCPPCRLCCSASGPTVFKIPNPGFTGDLDAYNLIWFLEHTEGCHWEKQCGSVSATLQWYEGDPGHWDVVFSGAAGGSVTYTLSDASFGCCLENVLSRVGGGSPATITVQAVPFGGACFENCCTFPDTLHATVTPEGCGGVEFVLNRETPGVGSTWTGGGAMGACVCPETPEETWAVTTGCAGADEWSFGMGAPTGDATITSVTVLSLDPVHVIATGTIMCPLSPVPISIDITE